MEQIQPGNTSLFQLNLDANNSYTLRSAASWAKVLGIIGIIFGILFVGIGLLVQNAVNKSPGQFEELGYRSNTGVMENMGTAGMVVYLCMGVITIIGSIFAFNFGGKIATALRTNDQNTLRTAFGALRNYFAYWGVLMIIGLLLMIIGIAAGTMQKM
ncbi:MAG: DUF5362 family protein [Bacteroidota bacterium]